METPASIVAYLRTSTDDQRLGIDAQRTTVARIASDRSWVIVKEFVEHESGGDCDRPELGRAIRHARRLRATLVVAKLDRLSRDSGFLMAVYDGNVRIIFGDLPEVDGSAASRLMVQMMANFAEFERRRIGERTKEALAALKAQGVKLGTPRNLTQSGRLRGSAESARRRIARAVEDMADVAEQVVAMRANGLTLRQIADALNASGEVTRNGAQWQPIQVARVLLRAMKTSS